MATQTLPSRRAVLAGALASACATPPPPQARVGEITRLKPELDAVIAPGAAIEVIGTGFQWAEGPVWVRDGGYLLFSDVPRNVMHRWRAGEGVTDFLAPSGLANADPALYREAGSNGLAMDHGGHLIVCDSGSRALARLDLATKQKTFLAERFEGKRFNSPNDCVVTRDGAIYFTDPPYGLANLNASTIKEMPFNGVYRWTPDGAVVAIDRTLSFPNGVGLSPDERTLYVSNSDSANPIIRVYDLGGEGLPRAQRTFLDASQIVGSGHPDGMKIDHAGRLFATGPSGLMVLSAAGEVLGVISVAGKVIANCAFGEDGATLFLTASDTVARVRTRTRGLAWA